MSTKSPAQENPVVEPPEQPRRKFSKAEKPYFDLEQPMGRTLNSPTMGSNRFKPFKKPEPEEPEPKVIKRAAISKSYLERMEKLKSLQD